MTDQDPTANIAPVPPEPLAPVGSVGAAPPMPAVEAAVAGDEAAYAKLKERRAELRRAKVRRRAVVAGVVVAGIVAVAAVVFALTRPRDAATAPITETAMVGTYTDQVSAKGKLQAINATVVSPEVEGTVATLNVIEGQQVSAGDVLLTIKNDDLDRAVADAERGLAEARVSQSSAYKAYNQQVDAYNASLSQATDDPASAPSEPDGSPLVAADNAVASAQATLDAARAQADKRTVRAPAAGSVVALKAQVGASLSELAASGQGAGLMQIADLSQMRVTVQVGEEDIARVARDQKAEVAFPSYDDIALEGTVTGIASVATEGGAGGFDDGSSTATFAVDVLLAHPDPRLKPGMTAEVSLISQQLDDVAMVPTSALLTDDGESYYVNVVTDPDTMASELRDVTVVAKNDDYAVVGRPADAPEGENADMTEAPVADGDTLLVSGGPSADAATAGAL